MGPVTCCLKEAPSPTCSEAPGETEMDQGWRAWATLLNVSSHSGTTVCPKQSYYTFSIGDAESGKWDCFTLEVTLLFLPRASS
jgi:hypothetical protein